jgi:DNA mismatch endonuclease (patch repair protein)
MADIIDHERRSKNMSRIRSRDTAPELAVRRTAHALGLRFRLHRRDLPGRPDLVFPRHTLVLFVHGCFWRRHLGCSNCTLPRTRPDFWRAKFEANVRRDQLVHEQLAQLGWAAEVIWECETEDRVALVGRLKGLQRAFDRQIDRTRRG